MAGDTNEIDLDDAFGIASFLVATKRVPPAGEWVDALIDEREAAVMEGFF